MADLLFVPLGCCTNKFLDSAGLGAMAKLGLPPTSGPVSSEISNYRDWNFDLISRLAKSRLRIVVPKLSCRWCASTHATPVTMGHAMCCYGGPLPSSAAQEKKEQTV